MCCKMCGTQSGVSDKMNDYTLDDVVKLRNLMDSDKSNSSIDITEKRRIMIADGLDMLINFINNESRMTNHANP